MPNESLPAAPDNFLKEYATPLSILAAGLFIAFGVYFALSDKAPAGQKTAIADIAIVEITDDDHIRGNIDAKIWMVEYSDTECPFCKSFDLTARQVFEKYGQNSDVAWVYRHFPITSLHPKAPKEAEAMECAAEQGGKAVFWVYYDKLYSTTNSNNSLDIGVYNTPKPIPTNPQTGQPYYTEKALRSSTDAGKLSDFAVEAGLDKTKFEECLQGGRFAERVQKDAIDASNAGGLGTPYIVFVVFDKKVSKDTRAMLDSLIPSVGPNTFAISKDGKRISMSGALPFDIVDQVVASLLND